MKIKTCYVNTTMSIENISKTIVNFLEDWKQGGQEKREEVEEKIRDLINVNPMDIVCAKVMEEGLETYKLLVQIAELEFFYDGEVICLAAVSIKSPGALAYCIDNEYIITGEVIEKANEVGLLAIAEEEGDEDVIESLKSCDIGVKRVVKSVSKPKKPEVVDDEVVTRALSSNNFAEMAELVSKGHKFQITRSGKNSIIQKLSESDDIATMKLFHENDIVKYDGSYVNSLIKYRAYSVYKFAKSLGYGIIPGNHTVCFDIYDLTFNY